MNTMKCMSRQEGVVNLTKLYILVVTITGKCLALLVYRQCRSVVVYLIRGSGVFHCCKDWNDVSIPEHITDVLN